MMNKKVRYILIDQRTDVGMVRELLRGRVFYLAILNYRWVEECLRKLRKVEIGGYNLERDYITTEESRMEVSTLTITCSFSSAWVRAWSSVSKSVAVRRTTCFKFGLENW